LSAVVPVIWVKILRQKFGAFFNLNIDLRPGWPALANFHTMGDCLVWPVFEKLQK
jgi:hypothetical protein